MKSTCSFTGCWLLRPARRPGKPWTWRCRLETAGIERLLRYFRSGACATDTSTPAAALRLENISLLALTIDVPAADHRRRHHRIGGEVDLSNCIRRLSPNGRRDGRHRRVDTRCQHQLLTVSGLPI